MTRLAIGLLILAILEVFSVGTYLNTAYLRLATLFEEIVR